MLEHGNRTRQELNGALRTPPNQAEEERGVWDRTL